MYTPVNPSFTTRKVGFKGIKIIQACFRDGENELIMKISQLILKPEHAWNCIRADWSGFRCPPQNLLII